MAGRVAVAVLLSLASAFSFLPSSASDCEIYYASQKYINGKYVYRKVVNEGESKTVYQKTYNGNPIQKSVSMYVHPGSDFGGLSLEVQIKTWVCVAGLSAELPYTDDSKWIKLNLTVITRKTDRYPYDHFKINDKYCKMRCFYYSGNTDKKVSVVTHGSSTWQCDEPSGETTKQHFTANLTISTELSHPSTLSAADCTLTPPQDSVTLFPIEITLESMLILVLVVINIALVVVVLCQRARHRPAGSAGAKASHPQQSGPATPATHPQIVMENSLYEPFSNFQAPAATNGHRHQAYVGESRL